MNTNDLKIFVQDILNNPEASGGLDVMMEKCLFLYREVTKKFNQAGPEEREHIAQALEEIGTLFEDKLAETSKDMGISPEELKKAFDNPENHTIEDWNTIQRFKKITAKERRAFIDSVLGEKPLPKRAKKRNSLKSLKTFA